MKKNIYQSPTLEINEIRLAMGICDGSPGTNPPGAGPEGGDWEQAPKRV